MKAAAVDISKAMCSRYFFHASHISFMSSVISHPNRYSLWVQEMFSFNTTGYTDEWFSYIAFRYELTQRWNYKQEKMDGRMHALHRVCWREIKKKIKSDLRNMYVLLLLYGWRLHHCQWIHAGLNSHDPCSD